MRRIIYWLPALAWAGVIFFFSSLPSLQSNLPGQWDFYLRKMAHITEYCILTGAIYFAFHRAHGLTNVRCLGTTALTALAFSVSDELHQYFVPGRSCRWQDVLIDLAGICIALALIKKLRK
jgi:VanZ family protein